MKIALGGPPVWCHGCGARMNGATKSADEIVEQDGAKRLENLQVTHQPCGCVWTPGGFLTSP